MASADPRDQQPDDDESDDSEPGDAERAMDGAGDEASDEVEADETDGDDVAGDDADGDGETHDEPADTVRPCLEQRFTPWLLVRTSLHPQGLVVEVNRFFSQRVAAVDFDRLVLEPAAVVKLRREVLWCAAACFTGGLLLTLAPLRAWAPAWLCPALLALAALCTLAAAISPRQVTMFLDREQVLHPIFLRNRHDEAQAADFVDQIRRAAIAWRCRPASPEDDDSIPQRPRLADTLDALLVMHQQELISAIELQRFREMAQQR